MFIDNLLKSFDAFLLILLRITTFLIFAPVFNSRIFPMMARLGLAFFLALIYFYSVGLSLNFPSVSAWDFVFYALREFLIGLVMGFYVSLIFSAFQLAGTIYGYQMGFGIISILDPEAMESVSLTGQLKYLLAILLFFATDCHHGLLLALFNSFRLIPIGAMSFKGALVKELFSVLSGSFLIALQIALPIMAILLIIDIGLGIIGRTIPQLNVFIIGFPLKIAIAFLTLMFILPGLKVVMEGILSGLSQGVEKVLFYLR
ncbi:MAG: flagellar biosynthetic protein FliR [Synergistetes bacterium]|nr:flagellar biosynthetic protein FliR [Synergistota bacterium]MDW8193046.1 flagellar biosynthetic protein FliR [Synergistota bacterium]